ncbi:MAG: rhomboid family intramembrane serine protease, partial [Planctomycetota bacterium]
MVNEDEGEGVAAGAEPRESTGWLDCPLVTQVLIGVCVAIFAYLNLSDKNDTYDHVVSILTPSAYDIWMGAWWALVLSAFVHLEILHILFNLWWAKDFGGVLEPAMGKARFLLFVLASAVVSSGLQLAVSDQTGIGFSGVVYALFGYGVSVRRVDPSRYGQLFGRETIRWLLGWLVLCIVLSSLGIWNIANAAHVGGFLFGLFWGNISQAKNYVAPSLAGLVLLLVLTGMSVLYLPWSEAWQSRVGITAWLSVVERAKAGDAEAQYIYASALMEDRTQKDEGFAWMTKAAGQKHLPAMNSLAWALATDPVAARRDGGRALPLAL